MPMSIESIEPTLRKHQRSSSSGDDSVSGCKRRKHRHRHRHHNHRYHEHRTDKEREGETICTKELEAEKFDGIEVEDRNLEKNGGDDGGSFGEVLVSGGSVFQEADSDMEEGEIVEDDNPVDLVTKDLEASEKDLHSDVESGEIGTKRSYSSKMGVNGVDAEGFLRQLRILGNGSVDSKQSGGVDQHMIFYSNGLVNGHCLRKSDKIDNDLLYGVCKRTGEFVGGVEQQSRMHSPSLEKRPRAVSPYHFHDKYVKESSSSSLSKSPEWAGGRSRSRSIVREISVEDYCFVDGKHQSEFDGVSSGVHLKIFPNSSEVGVTEKERKRDSRRYMDGRERHHNRNRDAYREGSEVPCRGRHRYKYEEKEWTMDEMVKERERNRNRGRGDSWDRDRARYIDKESDKDSYRERERRRHREREREKQRDSVKDRVREERSKEMDRGREFRNNGRDKYMLNGRDLLSRHTKFDRDEDLDRDRDFVYPYRKNSEDYNKERPSRSDLEKITSKHREELDTNNIEREGNSQEEYQEEVVVQLEDQEQDDLEKIKEESRRLRQAILEKHKCRQLQSGAESQDIDEDKVESSYAHGEVMKEKHESHLEGKDVYAPELSISGVKSPLQNGLADIPMSTGIGGLGEGTPMSERSDDIFGESPAEVHKHSERSDDIFCDDIFGESPADVRKPCKDDGLAIGKNGLNDNWDDAEGYYGHRLGEVLDGRYEIIAAQGKGVFSTVVRAKDLRAKPGDHDEVAIKIIRNNETMYKAGMDELVILKKLLGADPEDRRHCVCFLSTFKYRNHLCLVFESLHMNLREVLKKFGRNIGLKLTAVRTYAKQLFIALKHLKNCSILHCDIKPDNMLANEAKNVLKLCDFGSAMFSGKNEITPYLVSRFYRAPEIILGLPYDHPLDIWSVGCCLFELYTGKVLFPGATNNDMLRLHMELKGPFSKKMLRKGAFTNQHFDPDLNFIATEEDLVSKKAMRRMIVNAKPKDFGSLLSASPGEDPKMVANFKDLMEKILILDPDKRLTVSQALNHPFITGFWVEERAPWGNAPGGS